MTSSLVGSEMCIRDRSWRYWSWGHWSCAECRVVFHFLPHLAVHVRCAEPVSYTHLTLPTICSV
eukprot:11819218-Prorocentrum_lima.AAC.1